MLSKSKVIYCCSNCGEEKIIYKLYGMPSETILGELEKFGVEVETMGCVPPYADEKTYLFCT